MQLAVIGAAGRIGSRIAAEATGRGHDVTALARTEADVLDPAAVAAAVAGAEVVVTAAGHAAQLDDAEFYLRAARSVVAALRTLDPPPRLIVVGGFGSLRDPTGQQYADRPGLPAHAAPEIVGQRDALTFYRTVDDLHWTYLSPPPGGIAPGERTGRYELSLDTIGDREAASTRVSMEDYAVAVLDEAERAAHRQACAVVMH